MDLTMANRGGGTAVQRDYRKGNWNLQETVVLIEAKKMDDERRMKRQGDTAEGGKPAELRWKWVEDYCWSKGCFRSQNQCNDKWDNLMRDFKKVREFEKKAAKRGGAEEKSYWRMEKVERKGNNLPSNMLPVIYDALVALVERKGPIPVAVPSTHFLSAHSMQSPTQLTLPPTTAEPPASQPSAQHMPTVDPDTSEYSGSPAKRRRRGDGSSGDGDGGEGRGGVAAASTATLQEVGSAISKSASIIAEAIQSCEEREEKRHNELLNLHRRRLQIEESKAEINRQGLNGLVDAINKLANSMLSLAGHRTQS